MTVPRAALAGIALALTVGTVGVSATASSPPLARTEVRGAPAPGPLYAISWQGEAGTLARVEPATLRRTGRPIALGRFAAGSAFSPDGSRLALTRGPTSKPALRPALRVLDLRTRRLGPAFAVPPGGFGHRMISWLRPDRIVLVRDDELAVIDPVRRKVVRNVSLAASVVAVERAGDSLVLLLAPSDRVGAATLAVADADGSVRRVVLSPIPAGFRFDEDGNPSGGGPTPGLAVDPEAGHAYVLGGGTPVADVRLADLSVSLHELARPVSLLGRLRNWVEPAAHAKRREGPQREAAWLGGGLLAITGSDESVGTDVRGRPAQRSDPAGLHVVDTRNWTTHSLNESASAVVPADGALVTAAGEALIALEPDGARRWTLTASGLRPDGVLWTHGSFLYVQRESRTVAVVDTRTGTVLTDRVRATTLLSPAGRN
ncbi:MAG: hypothetical protein H0T39_12645 [Actinobacteria bacterium]|nr:hypothetical protein [Actinomycetota bacterium]